MTEKKYCSEVCGAQCCRGAWMVKKPCPRLKGDNTCSDYENRLSFTWTGQTKSGMMVGLRCNLICNIQQHLPSEVRDQCCVIHPELLEK